MSSSLEENLWEELESETHEEKLLRRHPHVMRFVRWLLPAALFALFAWVLVGKLSQSTQVPENGTGNDAYAATSTPQLVVDVKGDVRRPGVYTLSEGSRVNDAIKRAGGVRHQSDLGNVNQAAALDDGSEIIVPGPLNSVDAPDLVRSDGNVSPPEPSPVQSPVQSTASVALVREPPARGQTSTLIDLNTANASTLETIHGVGPKRATEIIDYRTLHGPFHSLDELRKIRGIGPKLFSQISQFVEITT